MRGLGMGLESDRRVWVVVLQGENDKVWQRWSLALRVATRTLSPFQIPYPIADTYPPPK
jgi:hypothetical protein